MAEDAAAAKRGYDLRKRLENMDQTRHAVLHAARKQLESEGYRSMTMASLAASSGVTRQTIHNLYGSKKGVLEALFDSIALEGGMEGMREVMQQPDPKSMLQAFVSVFCQFWDGHLVLFRRIHGIGAIDPDFGNILEARNQQRLGAAARIVKRYGASDGPDNASAALAALTSFEFYDALISTGRSSAQARKIIIDQATAALTKREAG